MLQHHRDLLKALGEERSWDAASRRLAMSVEAMRFLLAGLEKTHGQLVTESAGAVELTPQGRDLAYAPAPGLPHTTASDAGAEDVIIFEVPQQFDSHELVDGLARSGVVPRLRSGTLGPTITIALEALSGASGVVQLLVARDEIVEFCRRVVRKVMPGESGDAVTLYVVVEGRDRKVEVRAGDPDDRFVDAVLELVSASRTPPGS